MDTSKAQATSKRPCSWASAAARWPNAIVRSFAPAMLLRPRDRVVTSVLQRAAELRENAQRAGV
jgi:hypothetical protein